MIQLRVFSSVFSANKIWLELVKADIGAPEIRKASRAAKGTLLKKFP